MVPGMRIDYDDPIEYEHRWEGLSDTARHQAATADPLLFLADHVPLADRSLGALAVYAKVRGELTAVLIPGEDRHHQPDECLDLVAGIVGRLYQEAGADDFSPGDPAVVEALGIIHHRTGGAHVTDLDLAWGEALAQACRALGIEPIGVIARTRAGAVVRVPLPTSGLRRSG